jgi:hypothetical protein
MVVFEVTVWRFSFRDVDMMTGGYYLAPVVYTTTAVTTPRRLVNTVLIPEDGVAFCCPLTLSGEI